MWTDDGRTTEASHTISSPGAFGSGELKSLHFVVLPSENNIEKASVKFLEDLLYFQHFMQSFVFVPNQ